MPFAGGDEHLCQAILLPFASEILIPWNQIEPAVA